MCTVVLGLGALLAPLPFGPRVRRYALLALPVGLVAAVLIWDGHLGRGEGALLLAAYPAFIALVLASWRRRGRHRWLRLQNRPPARHCPCQEPHQGGRGPQRRTLG
jgi:Ca2+/Na+ antiporter